ncbi:MAG: hypothetical protein HYR88_09035 [Verrucomicrobia bacterium]|nr:hypothetical protein [Verrucomicrobiota bacterium]MBI3870892.1 hypothetical protein [Verrucomicrobiota bacterium]
MNSRAFFTTILLLGSLLPCETSTLQLKRETFRASGGDRFTLELPSGWQVDAQIRAGLPINTLRMVNSEGTCVLMISAIPGKESTGESMEELELILARSARSLAQDSVERQVRAMTFSSKTAFGVYATLTDSRRLGQKPAPGEFRFSTTFALNCSQRIVIATFLSNEEPFESVELAIMILKTLQREEGQS